MSATTAAQVTGRVFIGHGRSHQWLVLKTFITDTLGLAYDEFSRVPTVGVTHAQRLTKMLDEAALALIVLTAEDERADGKMQARQNVIHEVGLFQGRLGFDRTFVLIEESCDEFSNIAGLGQIRFPDGDIAARFEVVRAALQARGVTF